MKTAYKIDSVTLKHHLWEAARMYAQKAQAVRKVGLTNTANEFAEQGRQCQDFADALDSGAGLVLDGDELIASRDINRS
jgi:hypothetical protein